jgi:manganese-dependent ADP-ribose/CDP-alcohol diphosphatase
MDRREVVCGSAALAFSAFAPRASALVPKPLFRVGVVTDVQYADEDDAPPRLYRASPAKFREVVRAFNATNIDFAMHLGDFIDRDWKSFDTVCPIAADLKRPWHFVLGNHDFNVTDDKKGEVPSRLGLLARYYSFAHKDWQFVVLDGNDLSTYAWPAGSAELARSKAAQEEKYPDGKPWNGAIGPEQLAWLDNILTDADAHHRKVALLCHFPLFGADEVLLWNAAEVLAHIEPHPSVKLWLNGHEHNGNYTVQAGIHYLNFKGMLDTTETAYAVLSFHHDRVEVAGFGREPSRTLTLRSL